MYIYILYYIVFPGCSVLALPKLYLRKLLCLNDTETEYVLEQKMQPFVFGSLGIILENEDMNGFAWMI